MNLSIDPSVVGLSLATGENALIREFKEEINQEIKVHKLINVFENIYTYNGKPGHEVVLLYEAELADKNEHQESYEIIKC